MVTNTGNVPLTNVRITDSYDPALEPRESTAGWDPSAWGAGQLVWVVGTLMPGESTRRDVLCLGGKPAEAAVSRATVTSDEGVLEEARAVVAILPASPAPPGVEPPPKPPSTATTGNLVVDILEFGDPLKMGDQTAYVITIRNDRPTADQDVVLTIEFPPGLRFEKLSGPVARRNVSADGRTVRVSPIHEVRPGETLPAFRVEATGVQVGDHTMRVVVSSRLSPQGVAAEETTTVFSQ